jgi:hypothetical protein
MHRKLILIVSDCCIARRMSELLCAIIHELELCTLQSFSPYCTCVTMLENQWYTLVMKINDVPVILRVPLWDPACGFLMWVSTSWCFHQESAHKHTQLFFCWDDVWLTPYTAHPPPCTRLAWNQDAPNLNFSSSWNDRYMPLYPDIGWDGGVSGTFFCLGCSQTTILLISASQAAKITGVRHQHSALSFISDINNLKTFFLG